MRLDSVKTEGAEDRGEEEYLEAAIIFEAEIVLKHTEAQKFYFRQNLQHLRRPGGASRE
jgi:hypothetical protein